MNVRRAQINDIEQIKLLYQVQKVHSDKRPDLFIPGKKKYTAEELIQIIPNDKRPIFVADENGVVLGYAFCIFQHKGATQCIHLTHFISTICVLTKTREAKRLALRYITMLSILLKSLAVIILHLMFGRAMRMRRNSIKNAAQSSKIRYGNNFIIGFYALGLSLTEGFFLYFETVFTGSLLFLSFLFECLWFNNVKEAMICIMFLYATMTRRFLNQ